MKASLFENLIFSFQNFQYFIFSNCMYWVCIEYVYRYIMSVLCIVSIVHSNPVPASNTESSSVQCPVSSVHQLQTEESWDHTVGSYCGIILWEYLPTLPSTYSHTHLSTKHSTLTETLGILDLVSWYPQPGSVIGNWTRATWMRARYPNHH